MKRYLSLLLALVMVVGMIPAIGASAEETATTESIVENFDDVALSDAAPDAVNGILNYKEAVIASAPGRTGNAVKLYDADKATTPEIRFAHDSTTHVVVEFDIYATTTNNISLRFGTSALTAVFMQFRNTGVWNYRYDTASKTGAYELFSEKAEDAKLVANAWNSFRIEVTLVDGCGQTKLTVNGVDCGTSDAYYRTNTAMDNFYVQAVSASQCIYIDNLKMTADPTVHNFDSLDADAVPDAPFTNANMVKVTTAQKVSGTKSLEMKDSAAAGYPTLRLPTTKSSAFVAEFDFKVGSGSIQFRITNGASSAANTAYWIKTSGTGVYSYDQPTNKWVLMYTHSAYFVQWNTLRVEAGLEKAAVYLNGTKIFDAPRCGGTYGTNATTALDSIIFETGDNTNATAYLYLDNVKAAPAVIPAVEVNFDDVVISAPIESVPADGTESGFVDPHNATVVTAPGGKEGNALYLAGDGVTKPDFDYKFDFTEEFSYEFDFFVNGVYDAINFQSYTGCANTVDGKSDAYIFTLDSSSGLRTLNNEAGWATVNADVKPNLGQWNNLRVTVNADGEKQAVIYLNGEKVHETNEFYSKGDPLYGLYISTGSANQSAYIDNLVITPVVVEESNEGFEVTESGMRLVDNVTVDTLTVDSGKTLDLNGFTLTVNNLACFGSIVDTSEDNTGLLVATELALSDMTYMPISVDGGYKFFAYELKNVGVRENADGSVTYGFAIDFANADAYTLLASGKSGVDVTMDLAWGENDESFAFNAALVQTYAQVQVDYSALRAAMMLTVTGLDALEAGTELTVIPAVAAAGQVSAGEAMVYTVPAE